MKPMRIFLTVLLLLLSLSLITSALGLAKQDTAITLNAADFPVEQDGFYSTLEEVAVYLDTFGCLPENFISKRDAQDLGWSSRAGNLWQVAPGCSIGGDHFGNYEGNLAAPDGKKHQWTECDINFDGGYRGAERIIFSADGLIFYTGDHYQTFTQVLVVQDAPAEAKDGAGKP